MNARRAPSIKSIMAISRDLTRKDAVLVREIIKSTRKELNVLLDGPLFPSTCKWISSCYNLPSVHEVRMSMFDEILVGYGVEGTENFEYVNMGDAYNLTIVCHRGSYLVRTWGDIVESYHY